MRPLTIMAVCFTVLVALNVEQGAAQTIGFKLGPTFSKIDVDPDQSEEDDIDRLTSFGGGGFVRFGFKGLALQAEVLAITKGFQGSEENSGDDTFGEFEAKVKLSYIEIPLTAMFTFGNGPYVFGGPAVAFEIGCEFEVESDFLDFSADCDENEFGEDEAFTRKKMDIGVLAGAGFQFGLGPGSVLLEARHTWGLTDINDDASSIAKVRNRSIAVFAGYAIPIGRR